MWGKIIGSFAGFAMGGPLGAFVGAAAGHAYDKLREDEGTTQQLPPPGARPEWIGSGAVPDEHSRQMAFSIGVIVLSAKLAKVDGAVSRSEINAFKEVFRVPPQEVKNVARIFDAARQDPTGFEPYAEQIARLFAAEKAVLEDLLASLFHIARADAPIQPVELAYLRKVADIFALEHASFERVRSMFVSGSAADPYGVLGVSRTASDDEVKRIYRKLIREHHPDALIAKGLPKEFIEVANQKMAAINAAYDQVGRERGLK